MPLEKVANDIFEATVEDSLGGPVFVYDYPTAISPLSKASPEDPRVAERFELFVAGMELANAFSELNDPVDQRDRMMEQAAKKAEGDEEAEIADEDFLVAIEHGMPPAGGLGIGVDRVVQLMTGEHSLREVILFPTMRERQAERHELSDEDDGAS